MPNTCYMLHILAFTHIFLSFQMLHEIWRCISVARFDLQGNAKALTRGTGRGLTPRFFVCTSKTKQNY